MTVDRRAEFRERLLGNGAVPIAQPTAYEYVEQTDAPTDPVRVVDAVVVPVLDDIPAGDGYYNEKFVRGKIENWAGRPAGGDHHAFVDCEVKAARIEARMAASFGPIDHTDADITGRTLAALGEEVKFVLEKFHTTTATLQEIADAAGIAYGTCHARLTQGHVDFSVQWKDEWLRLTAELRGMSPAVDPSANAVPLVPLPRDLPKSSAWTTLPKPAPVLDYRKTPDVG